MNMNQASTTLINNKHKLQCGGQHASTKTHEICTHFVDQKNSLSRYIYINNPFPNGITKLITKDLSLSIYKVILRTLNSIMILRTLNSIKLKRVTMEESLYMRFLYVEKGVPVSELMKLSPGYIRATIFRH